MKDTSQISHDNSCKNEKVGYVALLGSPNAGKSTLMNACVGSKISIVSNKPQTTRNKILGISTFQNTQILFLDTPGVHVSQGLSLMNRSMNISAWSVLQDADILCYLIDVTRGFTEDDSKWIQSIFEKYVSPVLFIVTKTDKIKKDQVEAQLLKITDHLKRKTKDPQVIPLSAKRPEDVSKFRHLVSEHLPIGKWLYGRDDLTDRSQYFVCSEIIREQIFRQFGNELPYKIAVSVKYFKAKTELTHIKADIIVEKDSHKSMVIGKDGLKIKNIGMEARLVLEKHLESKVFLELFVQVQKNWTDNRSMLASLAHLESP